MTPLDQMQKEHTVHKMLISWGSNSDLQTQKLSLNHSQIIYFLLDYWLGTSLTTGTTCQCYTHLVCMISSNKFCISSYPHKSLLTWMGEALQGTVILLYQQQAATMENGCLLSELIFLNLYPLAFLAQRYQGNTKQNKCPYSLAQLMNCFQVTRGRRIISRSLHPCTGGSGSPDHYESFDSVFFLERGLIQLNQLCCCCLTWALVLVPSLGIVQVKLHDSAHVVWPLRACIMKIILPTFWNYSETRLIKQLLFVS